MFTKIPSPEEAFVAASNTLTTKEVVLNAINEAVINKKTSFSIYGRTSLLNEAKSILRKKGYTVHTVMEGEFPKYLDVSFEKTEPKRCSSCSHDEHKSSCPAETMNGFSCRCSVRGETKPQTVTKDKSPLKHAKIDAETIQRREILKETSKLSSKERFEIAVKAGIYTADGKLTKKYK